VIAGCLDQATARPDVIDRLLDDPAELTIDGLFVITVAATAKTESTSGRD
jgi:hypothetical protein